MDAMPRIGWIGPLDGRTLGDAPARRVARALEQTLEETPSPKSRPRHGMRRGLAILGLVVAIFCAASLHEAASRGSLRARASVSPGAQSPSIGAGDPEMQRMRSLVAGVVGVGVMAGGASAQQVVQWRVQDGGNGHWYQWKPQGTYGSWSAARDAAFAAGGYLASIRSEAEEQFARSVIGAWTCGTPAESSTAIGGFQPNPNDVSCCWEWVSGEPWGTWQPWSGGAPDNGDPSNPESIALMRREAGWNDGAIQYDAYWSCRIAALFEWSADCNNDGLVDYGQILSGQLADTNNNGVPDICEAPPCPGDITRNRVVDGIDLAAILAAWGGGKSQFDCDIDNDGSVGGSDLAIVLAGWGACP